MGIFDRSGLYPLVGLKVILACSVVPANGTPSLDDRELAFLVLQCLGSKGVTSINMHSGEYMTGVRHVSRAGEQGI
jgi:hypothetical protein